MTSGCTVRMPYFTVASNSVDRLMRLRAESTAGKPGAAIRQITRGDPCGAGSTRSTAPPGCASAGGSRARGLGAGYSAGRSACPWPRRSPRSVCITIRPLCFPGTSVGVSRLLAGAVPGQFRVAAVSPTFGRLFEGTDDTSPGQTLPAPTDWRRTPPSGKLAWRKPERALAKNSSTRKNPNQNAAERLAAGRKTVSFSQCRFH
jgi:hypothetical protein